ncbi:MAG: hypothetical protein A3H28_03195 [Acidobacteria bacterium RIFCSPLOWO2_02_FULL_61_28]|nr:MAG: hypothetical protein A3H28_03195 [Acidobacteria bacterium RIFCSPLOWO2_02_FULL_61_28]
MRRWYVVMLLLGAMFSAKSGVADTIILDADTPATGSGLGVSPLVTPSGTITFAGEIRDRDSDPDFNAAGALGNVFDISGGSTALMSFDFDVSSITFIYGGNFGVFDIEARDIGGVVLDSFFQASTDDGEPAGPITLSGPGIRSIFWEDPGNSFAPIDNLTIETARTVPEPSSLLLLGTGLIGFWRLRRKKA